ncbi:MAG TPA: hypothetical protein VMZ50_01670, partial [Phycisphaerae bacterium]|nr:hypothetical protein [Phycisphaerae bacterium]
WKKTQRDVRKGMEGPPDYGALAKQTTETLRSAQEYLAGTGTVLETVSKIPPAVASHRAKTSETIGSVVQATDAVRKIVGPPEDAADPKDPAKVLRDFVAAADDAIVKCKVAADSLDGAAGPAHVPYLSSPDFTGWDFFLDRDYVFQVVGGRLRGRNSVKGVILASSQIVAMMKRTAESHLRAANTEFQIKTVKSFRKDVGELNALVRSSAAAARASLDRLAKIDKLSETILKPAKFFEHPRQQVAELLKDAEALPPLQSSGFVADIQQPNIVIVQVGDQEPQVLTFDEVWPMKDRPFGPPPDPDEPEPRSFNGDSAISSKILSMTQKPFATVLLTYVAPPQLPPWMGQRRAPGFMPSDLMGLRRRLEQANLEVREWDLSQEFPADDPNDPNAQAAEGRPKVLLILPPPLDLKMPAMGGAPPPPGGFKPEHLGKIRKAIDLGTAAVFLAQWLYIPQTPWDYPLNEYLRQDWGIEARTDYLVIPASRAEAEPGKFNLDILRLSYFPLNTFSKHPIGRPLQGQRTLWRALCPIDPNVSDQPGVTTVPLLSVPPDWDDTWATRDPEKVYFDYYSGEGSYVAPDPKAGDLGIGSPICLAVAATRKGDKDKGVPPGRIVVLGLAAGVMDPYLTERVPVGDRLMKTQDPPRSNADLVINSVYWLSGRSDYIAAGPVHIKPVENVSKGTLRVLWLLCVLVLPLAALGIGGTVLLMRRR